MRYSFSASPFTNAKNIILPTEVIIDTNKGVVIVREPNLIGGKEACLNMSCTTISIKSGLLFSDVIVESAGGKRYVLPGFSRMEAESLLSTYSKAQGGMREKENKINRRLARRAAMEEDMRMQREMERSEEMMDLEERQLERIRARMDELDRLEQELAQKRQELAELQNQASDARVSRTSTKRRTR